MESIQEAFLMLNVSDKLPNLSALQKYALIYHSLNLKLGFICTGFQEDDPQGQTIVTLPSSWPSASEDDVVSFRYTHPSQAACEFYLKFLMAGVDGCLLEVNAMSSLKNNEIWNLEVRGEEALTEDKFHNLDSWVPTKMQGEYEREIVSKLLPKKKEEQKDKREQPLADPFPIGGGGGNVPRPPPSRPHIIGDPYI